MLSFSVENWKSFAKKTTLSMVASREKQHSERVAQISNHAMGMLPVAAIYGANASGKTKFFEAVAFTQKFITSITQPESTIPREHFKLDDRCINEPSTFEFILWIEKNVYEFSFAVTHSEVIEEKLIKTSKSSEKTLYHRKKQQFQFLEDELKQDQRLQFVARGTRSNQLFLTNSVSQQLFYFKPIYDWFKHSLVLINPDSPFIGPINEEKISSVLSKLDTGISRLGEQEISLNDIGIPAGLKSKLMENIYFLSEKDHVGIIKDTDRIKITKKQGEIFAKKMIPYHFSTNGDNIPFEMKDESAGTLRMIDLLPAFIDLVDHSKPKTYFIDEIDRCLHTLLIKNLLETYLATCTSKNSSQLLFTTHNALLMDQNILRRDEIWVVEKDSKGSSSLISFSEYKDVRADKDIRKSYLQGRLGGIPKILSWNNT